MLDAAFELNDFADLPDRPAPPVPPNRPSYLAVEVTYADGTTAEGSFEVSAALLPAIGGRVYQQIVDGPIPWPREGTGRSLVVLVPGRKPRVIGEATQWGDVGRVALIADRRTRTRSCGTYGNASARTRVQVRASDETWRVFDRRTGARLAERVFSAEMPACPDATSSNVAAEASPSREEIFAWLEGLPADA